jgi:hypothetical protein
MDTSNALIVSQAVVASRLAETRHNSLPRQARAAKSAKKRRSISLLQLFSPAQRLSPRHP